jgi:hypothetical protein
VVLIWAPLRWLVKPLLVLVALAVLALIVLAAITWTDQALGLLLGVAGWCYIIFGGLVGKSVLYELNDDEFSSFEWSWFSGRPTTVKALLALATLPVLVALSAVLLVLGTLMVLLTGLHDDYDVYRRFGHWFVGARLANNKLLSWIRPWLSVPIALAVCSVWFAWARFILVYMAGVAGGLLLFALVCFLVDLRREKQKDRRELIVSQAERAHTELMLNTLFELLHPAWAHDKARYSHWRARYRRYCIQRWGTDEYQLSDWRLVQYVEDRFYALFAQRMEDSMSVMDSSPAPVRQPSWFRRSLTVVADFLQLIWSAVLAKKWGICPWVEIPS